MKKILSFVLALGSFVTMLADTPLLVGHRGSQYGVENTVESFTNGAKMGYDYLETDFKVTKDLKFVCSHDDDISRLSSDGSSLSISGSTLAELQSHPFAQTRSGVRYTGRLCSAQEYLDVCREYGKRPLIELKWATGINSNDCSNIPLLIKFIEDNGFRDKCIILTSMKPCLEYIRRNYPDIELQFLTGEYWASHFDWCVQWNIDVDIQAGYFDKSTVTKFHDKGLKVNMWTTNTNDGYKQYGNWGCDFITTDYLDPTKLPELDASVTFPPNTVDYPNYTGKVRGYYDFEQTCEFALPFALSGRTIKKALFSNEKWIVLSFDENNSNPRIDIVDPLKGEIAGAYSTAGIEDLSDIAMSADGLLIGCNRVTLPYEDENNFTKFFRLYKWDGANSQPTEFYNTNTSLNTGNFSNAVAGEHLAVSGRFSSDMKVYVSSWSAAADVKKTRLVGFIFQKGTMDTNAYDLDTEWGTDYTITVSPTSRDCIIINSPNMDPVEYKYIWGTRATIEEYDEFPEGLMATAATGLSFHRRATKVYGVLPTLDEGGVGFTAAVYDVVDGMGAAAPVTEPLHEGLGTTHPGFTATAMANHADGKLYVHFLTQNHGLATFALNVEGDIEEPLDVDLELTRDWIYSVSTGNAPENIDGTNAQQGTAVNGLFYINNCVEKKLHVFDENGYVGYLPGGAGWGCARDDAGNIIIRDDKLTGKTHSFLVYPAGSTPDNHETAVRLEADVVYEGQTNFINAGGDVLNGIGHIYLYPNGQSAVNILTVANGSVSASKGYADLTMNGTAAGYVIPVNDDTETWLYQIRGTGIYMYNGGESIAVSTTRTSTSAPSRNSTGGAAYFKVSGNQILVHNSGANYLGGFTVRNLTTDKVITSINPIGDKGYSTGGNYSTFNWLIPEKITSSQYRLYQYCPANGLAVYTLTDKNNSVGNITVDNESNLEINVDHNTLTVIGADVRTLRVYNVAGVLVASSDSDTADISALTPGLYIVKINNAESRKFMKK